MNEPESMTGAGGGVGPLHEAIDALPVMWHGPKDATVGNGLVAYVPRGAVLRVVGTHLHAEIEPLRELDIGNEVADVAWREAIDDVLAVVDALVGHPDAH